MRVFLIFLVVGLVSTSQASYQCLNFFLPKFSDTKRSYEESKVLKFMTYNVENLFVRVGKFVWENSRKLVAAKPRPGREKEQFKSEQQINWIRSIILEERPDFLFLQEVEDIKALEFLAKNELEGRYRPFLIEGNDGRGIDVGFLVRTDLPFQYEYISHKDMMFKDPVDGEMSKLFSRDVPALIVRKEGESKPLFILLGNHAKSKRDRPGDPESFIWRSEQYKGIAQIVQNLKNEFGADVPIMLGGDFNTDVQKGKELGPIRSILKSAFDLAKEALGAKERVTHTYHPRGAKTQWSQLDDMMMTGDWAGKVLWTYIYRYKNKDGEVMPIPNTFNQRKGQPSDHFPVGTIIQIE